MIPKLYDAAETAFTTEGLGRLTDAISCTVEEERNGKYELEMEYPVNGIHFSEIAHSCFIYAKPSDSGDPQPFSIYSISKPINGRCTIRGEHISYRLINIPVVPCSATSPADALLTLKNNAVEPCPFTFWTDKTSSGTFTVKEPASLRSRLAGSEGSILDSFGGGEYEWDGMTVKLHANRGANRGVTLRYGKNITDLKQEENIQNTFTGVMPYWKKEETDGTNTVVMLTERVVYSANAGNFPYNRTKIIDCSSVFENQPAEIQLRNYANRYVQASGVGVPEVNITVKFLPLWQTEEYKNVANLEHVNLCDTVTVVFEKLGISATSKVVRTKYDVLRERYNEIELGDAKRSLSTTIRSDIDAAREEAKHEIDSTASFLREEMEEAIGQIVQGDDGYIVFSYNANNQRTQILAMDNMDISQAQKILLINHEGIGGFSNGISDPTGYNLAITTDGKVIAESITAGTIKSALLIGNVLKVGGSGTNGTGSIQIYDNTGTGGVGDTLIGKWDRNGLDVKSGTIRGTTIHLGGSGNGDGVLHVKDSTGNTDVITMGRTGITVHAGTIQGPTIIAGGTYDGEIQVQDASGNPIGSWDKTGIKIYKGTIQGPKIVLGGADNTNGILQVKDASDTDIITMGQSGILVKKGTIQGPTIIAGGANNANGVIYVKDADGTNIVTMNNSGASIIGSIESRNPNGSINGYSYQSYISIKSSVLKGGVMNVQSGAPISSGSCGEISFSAIIFDGDSYRKGIILNPTYALEIKASKLLVTVGSGTSAVVYTGKNKTITYTSGNSTRKMTFYRGILTSDESA